MGIPFVATLRDTQNYIKATEEGFEEVGETACTHLKFKQEELEWELWVANKDQLPRKFVIHFVHLDGKPKIEVNFAKWELDADLKDVEYAFDPPNDFQKIEIISRKDASASN